MEDRNLAGRGTKSWANPLAERKSAPLAGFYHLPKYPGLLQTGAAVRWEGKAISLGELMALPQRDGSPYKL